MSCELESPDGSESVSEMVIDADEDDTSIVFGVKSKEVIVGGVESACAELIPVNRKAVMTATRRSVIRSTVKFNLTLYL